MHSRLGQKGSASTHGVPKRSLTLPSRQLHDGRCQSFLQWRFHALSAIAAFVHAQSQDVQSDSCPVFTDVQIEEYVWILSRKAGTFIKTRSEAITDSIFEYLAAIQGMPREAIAHVADDAKALVYGEKCRPIDVFCGLLMEVFMAVTVETK